MSNRKPTRKKLKIDPSLLTEKSKVDKYSWVIVVEGEVFKVTLHPTKGYSKYKLTAKDIKHENK